ncbi:MAG: hypothetical protein ABII90_08135 [Bacteroidota bacterium]
MSIFLSEIDKLYREIVSKTTKDIRIDYCNRVIDKAQFVLETTKKYLSKYQKEQLREKIIAAQKEIEMINQDLKH